MTETGKIKEIRDIENVGAHTKRTIVIETIEQHPRVIAFSAWNDKAKTLDNYSAGMIVEVEANASSKEYNGRWYTELTIWKINPFIK